MNRISGIIISIAILISTFVYGQNSNNFFKHIPIIESDAPSWVHKMYSDNPDVEQVVAHYHKYYRDHIFEKNIHTQNFKYWLKKIEGNIDLDGKIKKLSPMDQTDVYEKIKSQKKQVIMFRRIGFRQALFLHSKMMEA